MHYAAPTPIRDHTAAESCWNTMDCCQLWEDKQKKQGMPQVILQFLRQKNPTQVLLCVTEQPNNTVYNSDIFKTRSNSTSSKSVSQWIVSNMEIHQLPQPGSHFIQWQLCFCFVNFIQQLWLVPLVHIPVCWL